MILTPCAIAGVYLIEVEPKEDDRGFFARTFCAREFARASLHTEWVQSSISYNRRAGTLRGLHYQAEPHQEIKVVRCISGAIFDVAVDLRAGSPTFGRWFGVELSRQNRRALYIPKGCAHGFQTLVDDTEVAYDISAYYSPEHGRGVRFDDPSLGIAWPDRDGAILSPRDRELPLLGDVDPSPAAAPGGAS